MKQAVLFLLLAAGGLVVLSIAAGGFLGSGPTATKPEVASAPAMDEGRKPVLQSDWVQNAGRGVPPTAVTTLARFSHSGTKPQTWSDPVTGERIEFPDYVLWHLKADDTAPVPETTPGEHGMVVKGVAVDFFKEVTDLTREEARALKADPATLPRLLRFHIESGEGRADFLAPMLTADHKTAVMRKILRLPGEVRVRDTSQGGIDIVTTDVLVDLDAGNATGRERITATSPAWRLSGRGFRVEKEKSWLEILEDADFTLTKSADGAAPAPAFDLGGEAFRPDHVFARGGAVVAQKPGDRDAPVEVRLSDRVHVEQKGGRTLDADAVTLTLTRRPTPPAAAANGNDHPAGPPTSRYQPTRLLAEGRVSLGGSPAGTSSTATVLTLTTERLESLLGTGGARTAATTCEGPTVLSYEGLLAFPGSSRAPARVVADCHERMTFGPAPENAPAPFLLRLLGDASVLVEPVSRDERPERLTAPTIDLYLRRRTPAEMKAAEPKPGAKNGAPGSSLVSVEFNAVGGVRLEGPRLSGTAARLDGFRLDRPDSSVVASGDGVVFEVPQESDQFGVRPQTDRKSEKAESRGDSLRVRGFTATGKVRGRLAVGEDASPVDLAGEGLVFDAVDGGRLIGTAAIPASVSLSEAGREESIRSRVVFFRTTDAGRRVWTESSTRAVVWVGGDPAATGGAHAAAGPRVLVVRGGKRVEFRAAPKPATADAKEERTAALVLEGGGILELRVVGRPADEALSRLAADRIEVALGGKDAVGGAGFLGSSRGTKRAGAAKPAPEGAKPATATRWEIACGRLDLSTRGDRGRASLSADGGVVATGAEQRFEGKRLVFDGPAGTGLLEAADGERTLVSLGKGGEAQTIRAPRVEFTIADGKARSATFRAPVVADLFQTDEKTGERTRVGLFCDGDLEVGGDGATTEGATQVVQTPSAKPGQTPSPPIVLTTKRLTVTVLDLLAGKRSRMSGFVAEGKGTRVEIGREGEEGFTRAIGDRLEYVAATNLMTMTGVPDVWFEGDKVKGTARAFHYDVLTRLPDPEGLNLFIAGPPR